MERKEALRQVVQEAWAEFISNFARDFDYWLERASEEELKLLLNQLEFLLRLRIALAPKR